MLGTLQDVERGLEDGAIEVVVVGWRAAVGLHEVLTTERVVMFESMWGVKDVEVGGLTVVSCRKLAYVEQIFFGDFSGRKPNIEAVDEGFLDLNATDISAVAGKEPVIGKGAIVILAPAFIGVLER